MVNYRKISQEELEDLTLENGRKLLLSVGYVEDGSYSDRDEYDNGGYYHYDQYYTLYNSDEDELDRVSFVTIYEKTGEYSEDDKFIRTYWNSLYV